VAWSRQLGRLVNVRATESDLLLERFDGAGAVEGARRVSSALSVLAAAVTASGDAVVFCDGPRIEVAELWLAFLDLDGRKRGPDLRLGPCPTSASLAPGVELVSAGPGRSSLFLAQPSGVTVREVRCE
jgi:hypothetical protein